MSRRDRRRLRDVQRCLLLAEELMQEAVLSLDARYAVQEAAWQEGAAGRLNCEATAELRERIELLRGLTWPAVDRML